jgi:hypothetical protein
MDKMGESGLSWPCAGGLIGRHIYDVPLRSEIAVFSRRVMPVRMCVCCPHLGIFRFNSNLIEMSRYLVVSRNI